jgi:hypothetical protein
MEEPLILVRYEQHHGRMGDIECLFATTQARLTKAMGYRISLGDALGKHSQIMATMCEDNTTIMSDDQDKIDWLQGLGILPVGWDLVEMAEEEREEDRIEDSHSPE